MNELLIIPLLLSGCTILFSPITEIDVDDAKCPPLSAYDGAKLVDAELSMDIDASTLDAQPPDGGAPDSSTLDAQTIPDATPCDPFASFIVPCYVGNDPLSGPSLVPEVGGNLPNDLCDYSRECLPRYFCGGGRCRPLCDDSHACRGATCVNLNYKGYGYCE